MAGDYIPRKDSDLRVWTGKFIDHLEEYTEELRIDPAVIESLRAEQESFASAHSEYKAAETLAAATCRTKDDVRKNLVAKLRSVAQQVQTNPDTTNGHRAALGLTIKSRKDRTDVRLLKDVPVALIDTGNRLRHVMRIRTRTDTGIQRRRPAGIIGCEVWRTLEEPATKQRRLQFAGLATQSVFVVEYPVEAAGKNVRYMLRWIDHRGNTGKWSQTFVATVAA